MYINTLIRVYNENFGFWYRVKDTFKRSKVILFPIILLISSTICFYTAFIIEGLPFRIILMVISILIFVSSIIWASFIQKKSIKEKYGGIVELESYKLNRVEDFLRDNLGIVKIEHYTLLDSLVKKEIEEIEDNKSFPFINTIRQLIIAVLITGLLSYSFKQIADGDSVLGQSLLALYIMIIGTLIIVGSFIYSNREFTRKYKLKQISKMIIELQLKLSLQRENCAGKNARNQKRRKMR